MLQQRSHDYLLYLDEQRELDPECLVRDYISTRRLVMELQQYSSDDEVGN